MKKRIEYLESSGNPYADLGFPDAQERLAKIHLAMQINELIEKEGLNQTEAAALLAIDKPKISALSQGKIATFSLESLFQFLTILKDGAQ